MLRFLWRDLQGCPFKRSIGIWHQWNMTHTSSTHIQIPTVRMFSIAGIPPLAGFYSKLKSSWYFLKKDTSKKKDENSSLCIARLVELFSFVCEAVNIPFLLLFYTNLF